MWSLFEIFVFYAFYAQNEGLRGPFLGQKGGKRQKFQKVITQFFFTPPKTLQFKFEGPSSKNLGGDRF